MTDEPESSTAVTNKKATVAQVNKKLEDSLPNLVSLQVFNEFSSEIKESTAAIQTRMAQLETLISKLLENNKGKETKHLSEPESTLSSKTISTSKSTNSSPTFILATATNPLKTQLKTPSNNRVSEISIDKEELASPPSNDARLTKQELDIRQYVPQNVPQDISLTSLEAFVKGIWPEAILERDINNDTFTSRKNKVVIKPEWRLDVADEKIFDKLSEIQSVFQVFQVFQVSLIPYCLWVERLTYEMSNEFMGVKTWAIQARHITWTQLLEAIFIAMKENDVLHSP